MAKQHEPAVNLPIKTPQDVSLNKQGISKAQGAVENATDSTTTDKQLV
jgi:hypothetical protein